MERTLSRRGLLASVAASLGLLGGCLDGSTEDDGPPRLGAVELRNGHDRAHDVRVTVLDDGETMYERAVSLDAASDGEQTGRVLTGEFDTVQDGLTVEYAVDGGERERVRTADFGDEPCYVLLIRIGDGGDDSTFTTTGYECEAAQNGRIRS
ncbi:hypothetical protein [Haloarchaeobius iranensis]|uniref:Uncharacterized protein n=1 Tax=Haloarchaeobius iranensis TaxID=996166 RepID=A0A1G9XMA3_9EURY|nr:hypothetical protein [Haloarchaeobius iranensis]SDM97373.1 hypothetical protein SAMN05192554_11110 [Haloarchaeobius iranensis]